MMIILISDVLFNANLFKIKIDMLCPLWADPLLIVPVMEAKCPMTGTLLDLCPIHIQDQN